MTTRRTLAEFLPNPLYEIVREKTVIGAVYDTLQEEFDRISDRINEGREAGWLATAGDHYLNAWGERFKTLGKRRGLGEEEYRRYLRTGPLAYRGLGRRRDLRQAIASGILVDDEPFDPEAHVNGDDSGGPIELAAVVDPTDPSIASGADFSKTAEYDLVIHDHGWSDHPGGLVRYLAKFADVAGAKIRTVRYEWGHASLGTGEYGVRIAQTAGLASVGTGGESVRASHDTRGAFDGIGRFDGEDQLGSPDYAPGNDVNATDTETDTDGSDG